MGSVTTFIGNQVLKSAATIAKIIHWQEHSSFPHALYHSITVITEELLTVTHLTLVEAEDSGGEGSPHIALGLIRIVQEPQLQRDHPFIPEVNVLDCLALLPVPHMQAPPVFS